MDVDHVELISPAYEEAENLPTLVNRVESARVQFDFDLNHLIVVNDGDPSRTPAVADNLAEDRDWLAVHHRADSPNYAMAVQDGFQNSTGDVVVPFMSDLSDDLDAIPLFVTAVEDGADFVYASRFREGGAVHGYPAVKLLSNRCFNTLAKYMFRIDTSDLSNGFSAYRRQLIDTIDLDSFVSESFEIMIELKLRAHLAGFESREVPVSWHGREVGESKFGLLEQGHQYLRRLILIWWKSKQTDK